MKPLKLLWITLFALAGIAWQPAHSLASAFAGNKLDDMFTVKEIKEGQAVLEGKPKDLKAGGILYFARSPFKFTVTAVEGEKITIQLPSNHDLAVGNTLVRNQTEAIKKGIDTEKKLKQALEE